MEKRAVIFVNGNLPNAAAAKELITPTDFLLAVDGGTRHALALGLLPTVVIGDLDSLDAANRPALEREGVQIIPYPADKDETDLELALDYLTQRDYKRILLVAALGGRLDQTLGNLALLTAESRSGLDLRLDDGAEEVFFIRTQAQVRGRNGEIVSLIPWGAPVNGIRTEGLRWSLRNETLYPHKTRGISNEMTGSLAKIQIENGLLLVVHHR
jgi:thiamine pyrophosphokinase